jgi:hypothetical protein
VRFSGLAVTRATLLLLGMLVLACGGDDGSDEGLTCVEGLADACTPAFDPTWQNVYANVVSPTCGGSGSSCHAAAGKQGGLDLSSAPKAHAALLGHDEVGKARVVPGDPACSILMERIETSDLQKRMPLGAPQPLSAATRCAVQQWIEKGASP